MGIPFAVAKVKSTETFHVFHDVGDGWTVSICGAACFDNVSEGNHAADEEDSLRFMRINDECYCQRCVRILVKQIVKERCGK